MRGNLCLGYGSQAEEEPLWRLMLSRPLTRNTFRLLDVVRRAGFVEPVRRFVRDGGDYYGGSAGAVLACDSIEVADGLDPNEPGLRDLTGLGLIKDLAILPHYSQDQHARAAAWATDRGVGLLGLPESIGLQCVGSVAGVTGEGRLVRFEGAGGRSVTYPGAVNWSLRPSVADDARWIAELRAEVMAADLHRLGRWDPVRVRERFLRAFRPSQTKIIRVDGVDAGSIAVRPEPDCRWIEHFYLSGQVQGRGVGSAVLGHLLDGADHCPYRLNVFQGSRARHLYERHGFVLEHEDPVDVFMIRPSR
ncbi:MAG TPA: GNAT family N-acetyltransferase [Microlunatus sp.]